jgi:hypothetical protein
VLSGRVALSRQQTTLYLFLQPVYRNVYDGMADNWSTIVIQNRRRV